MDEDTQRAITEFLVESHENLDRVERELVSLEANPDDRATLASVFRSIHTIKGTCGFLAFSRLEAVAHVGESLLAQLRDGKLYLTPTIASGLLAMVDAFRRILARIETDGCEPDHDYSPLIAELTRLNAAELPGGASGGCVGAGLPADAAPADGSPAADSALRVDVGLLDRVMNLVGELVLARNQVMQVAANDADPVLAGATQRLNLVTTELQESVMKARMQPIGTVWTRFPRIVRDLSAQCGKQVRVQMEGQDTDLDRTVIEAIKDPLTHVVRNAVDHGIEDPSTRVQRGKPAEGEIRLRAYHEGGHVHVEMSDDGAGIDPAKVRAAALARGVISQLAADRITDHELTRLIFQPGFSTAERVTSLSGRGVGMDVVKTNIEKIGGQVDVASTLGRGTTVRIRIPLTLAIIQALLVTDRGGRRYAIPQANVLELVRLDGSDAQARIEWIGAASFYRLRGNLLPLVPLEHVLGARPDPDANATRMGSIVVLDTGDRQFGLVVDAINDTEEIVVKPLGKWLRRVNVFSGATIMGDGQVVLILDVPGLARRARVLTETGERDAVPLPSTGTVAVEGSVGESMLVFRASDHAQMAIALRAVARLEEFAQGEIEYLGAEPVVQYRGGILPLVDVGRAPACTPGTTQTTIVLTGPHASVGLVVEEIVDIVHETVVLSGRSTRSWSRGTAVVHGRATEVIDADKVFSRFAALSDGAAA